MQFSKLEIAVLSEFAIRHPSDKHSILEQTAAAQVTSRENTGKGFRTYMRIAGTVGKMDARILSNVYAEINSLENLMSFVIFCDEAGKLNTLEGSSVAEYTTSIDFTNVEFKLSPFLLEDRNLN